MWNIICCGCYKFSKKNKREATDGHSYGVKGADSSVVPVGGTEASTRLSTVHEQPHKLQRLYTNSESTLDKLHSRTGSSAVPMLLDHLDAAGNNNKVVSNSECLFPELGDLLPVNGGSIVYMQQFRRTRSTGALSKLDQARVRSQFWRKMHGEELIVTPFAQVLATLRNVRENIVSLTQGNEKAGSSSQRSQEVLLPARSASGSRTASDEPSQQLVHSTLMELDWCLEQLEAIQTHRSVSEMTSSKFRKMLTKELSQFSDSKSGDQLSRFIFTFMGHDDDLELASEKQKQGATVDKKAEEDKPPGSSVMMVKGKQHVTSSMSHISGVRKLKRSPTGAEESVAAAINEPTLIACTGKYNPDLAHCIDEIDRWGMDIFKLHRLCDSHSLTVVTFTIMKNRGLIKEFRLNTTKLLSYLLHLEDHYRQNSYHNSTHAADVTQTVHAMLNAPSVNSAFTDLEKFAVIIAAAIHDVDHPGLTNQFLVNSGSELAIMYNDESVLEQHHLAVAFKLLQESDCDILTGLTQKHRQLFRRIVIDTVLATDMSKHMSLLADLKTMVETKKLSGPGLPKLEKYGDRIQVLQNLIHIADLSNPAKPLALYEQWVDRLLEEYWAQGDKEKELGLEVSPMCDRQNVSREKSQVGFIDYIVHPLMETWADLVYPDGQHILDQLERNRNSFFLRLTEKDQEEFPPAV